MSLPSAEEVQNWPFARLSAHLRDFHDQLGARALSNEEVGQWAALIDVLFAKVRQFPEAPPPLPELTHKDKPRWAGGYGLKYRQHQQLLSEYLERKALWEAEAPTNDAEYITKWRIAEGRKKELLQCSGQWPLVKRLVWTLLPSGEWPTDAMGWSRLIPQNARCHQQPERLMHAQELGASGIYVGVAGDFERYAAFEYPNTTHVLLESCDYGNAAYVLAGDWQHLSRMTKYELIHFHWVEITRVFHRDDGTWRSSIREALLRL